MHSTSLDRALLRRPSSGDGLKACPIGIKLSLIGIAEILTIVAGNNVQIAVDTGHHLIIAHKVMIFCEHDDPAARRGSSGNEDARVEHNSPTSPLEQSKFLAPTNPEPSLIELL
jgi:hypothetical protein